MELRVLRYFLAVCREGSISHAAESLHLTQPTLSRQIAEMERELGCELLSREGRRLVPTEKGALLRRRAAELVALAEQAEREMRASDEQLEGVVRIAAGESWVMEGIARAMGSFRDEHPAVSFAVHSGNAEDVSWRLDRGLADFAVFMSNPRIEDYDHMRLPQTDAWGLLMPEGHPLSEKDAIGPEDLAGVGILVSERTLGAAPLASWLGGMRDKLDVAGTYTLAFNAAMLVRAGVGCALVLDRIVQTGPGTGLELRLLYPPVVSFVDFAWKRYEPLSPAAEGFLKELGGSMRKAPSAE